MKWKAEEVKTWSIAAFYIVLIISMVVLIVPWLFVDWEQINDDLAEGMMELASIAECTIDYCGFHYEGMCIDEGREEILAFLSNITCAQPVILSCPQEECPECEKCDYYTIPYYNLSPNWYDPSWTA
jgi:hypothetical protein